MKRMIVPILALGLLVSCMSSENYDEILISDAEADSAENVVALNKRRAQRADDSLEDYRVLADQLEGELLAQRDVIRGLRDKVNRNAKQIDGQKKEIEKLQGEVAALQKSKGELNATIASERKLIEEAKAELRRQEEQRSAWSSRLQAASALHAELQELVDPLLARFPAPEPPPEEKQPAEAEQKPAPQNPAPAKEQAPEKPTAKPAPAGKAPAK